MRSTKTSLIVLLLLMVMIGLVGRNFKLYQEKSQVENWSQKQIQEIKKENDNLKKERDELKRQVQAPIRERVAQEIQQVFGSKAKEALAIVQCENNPNKPNYNPYNIHINKDGSKDYGVFQIHGGTWIKVYGDKFMNDYKENIRVAKAIFDRSGDWRMWKASSSCHGLLAEK